MPERNITLSVVSHGQNALVNQVLEDIQRHCADRVALVLTENVPDPTPLATAGLTRPVQRIANDRIKGFGANHNAAFKHCRTPYFCVVNPDIRLPADPFPSLISNFSDETVAVAGPDYPTDWSARLFYRRQARWSDDNVHEKVLYAATPGVLEGDLLHESAEDLGRYLEKQNRYTTLAAAELHRRGQRAGAIELVFSPMLRFFKFYVLQLGFLDGLPGLVHISIGCMNSFMKYAKLAELRRADGK